jgi:hypothetical protein
VRTSPLVVLVALVACGGNARPTPDAATTDPFRCDLAECRDSFARTCDGEPLTLDCSAFQGSCQSFFDVTGTPFSWCDCGPIAEGQGRCLDGRNGVTCDSGVGIVAQCLAGTNCVESPGDPFGLACVCDNVKDSVCPDAVCVDDPDCSSCTPSCSGKQCGSNGCGGDCGACPFGQSCDAAGQCQQICVPDCTGKQCGSDGCGGSCGTCNGTCTADGQCQGTCVPSCTGRICGSDGCTGSCGSCPEGLECQPGGDKCDCSFFSTIKYMFALDTAATWPSNFSFVVVNVRHIDIDGTDEKTDGEFLGFRANDKQTFVFSVFGCKPHIQIKVEYALSGKACEQMQTVTDRTSFTIPPPIINADGSCTAPPL